MLEALEHQDVELARWSSPTTTASTAATSRSTRASSRCSRRQAPVAGDLRLVAALLHVIKHVERMGDQCVNIAKLIPLSGHEPPVRAEMLDRILRMGRAARSEVVQAQAGLRARATSALAEDLVRQDREINRLNREIFQLAIEIGDDPDTREWAMHMTMVARALERDRRQRRRHRRGHRVRRHRAVPRVLGLLGAHAYLARHGVAEARWGAGG